MHKDRIKDIIERHLPAPGVLETALGGVRLFRVTEPLPCVPAVYEPTVVAIVGGSKEAVVDGRRHLYDHSRYLVCPMTLPVEAGTPEASPERPLLGVAVSLDPQMMRDLVIELEAAGGRASGSGDRNAPVPALALAPWEPRFAQALSRFLELLDDPVGARILGPGRRRELCLAVLRGAAGATARRAFGVGNAIARTIDHLAAHLNEAITVDDLADLAGMSRAVFHRRFKEATGMSPIQFVKTMRLSSAAMKIAAGKTVNAAAWEVGYASPSQFSRDFRRMYGQPPKAWGRSARVPAGVP